ncbi:MAG: hypothetical protein ACKVX7_19065 [Planctomycetota bacterium]
MMSTNCRRARVVSALTVFWLCVATFTVSARDIDAPQFLADAQAAYRAGLETTDRDTRLAHFSRALVLFESVAESVVAAHGSASADLYVNLGNAALQCERLGPAVLAYRRALEVAPSHRRARQNLEQARTLLPAWTRVEPRSSVVDSFFFWHHTLTRAERELRAGVAFVLAALLFAAALRYNRGGLRTLALVPLAVWLALVASLVVESLEPSQTSAVVIADEAIARAADAPAAQRAFAEPLPSGTEVAILECRENWRRIAIPNGRTAWLDAAQLAEVQLAEVQLAEVQPAEVQPAEASK